MKKAAVYWEELKQGPIHNTASFNLSDAYKIIKMGSGGEICSKPQTNQQKLWEPHQVFQPHTISHFPEAQSCSQTHSSRNEDTVLGARSRVQNVLFEGKERTE